MITQGKRVNCPIHELQPCEYTCYKGVFYFRTPDVRLSVGSLAKHCITEHADGTITVTPSILVKQEPVGSWHGYLENGIWRQI